MERWLRFTSTQAGRDKIYRFIQYFSRFLSYHLRTKTPAIELATRLAKLSLAVGLGRKRKIVANKLILILSVIVFRVGKPLDFFQSLLKSLTIKDEIIRWGSIFKSTGYGSWLILDMFQWVP